METPPFADRNMHQHLTDALERAIDAQHRTEVELERSVARVELFRLAVEACPSGMVMVGDVGTIVLVNAATELMFGYPREELIGQPIESLVPERFRPQHPRHRQRFLGHPEAHTMGEVLDLCGLRKDGSELPVEVELTPIPTREGLLVLNVIIDISERKQAKQALLTHARQLQRLNAELEQFAYVASHDMQEPLRMVASYTELLAERYQGQLDERADRYIRYAVDGARRMQQLINDLLSYSRIGTQGKPFVPVASWAVVNDVLVGLQSAIEGSGADLVCDQLPTVNADEVQLRQLFQNLISNALKFRSERPLRIQISAQPGGGEWIFAVQDNGIGIEPGYSERVFQMFQRLHERGKYEGSGIGLALAKKIVERHGCRIWFTSTLGEGTTFYFTMPGVEGDGT